MTPLCYAWPPCCAVRQRASVTKEGLALALVRVLHREQRQCARMVVSDTMMGVGLQMPQKKKRQLQGERSVGLGGRPKKQPEQEAQERLERLERSEPILEVGMLH
jgi:hypothetical protein